MASQMNRASAQPQKEQGLSTECLGELSKKTKLLRSDLSAIRKLHETFNFSLEDSIKTFATKLNVINNFFFLQRCIVSYKQCSSIIFYSLVDFIFRRRLSRFAPTRLTKRSSSTWSLTNTNWTAPKLSKSLGKTLTVYCIPWNFAPWGKKVKTWKWHKPFSTCPRKQFFAFGQSLLDHRTG